MGRTPVIRAVEVRDYAADALLYRNLYPAALNCRNQRLRSLTHHCGPAGVFTKSLRRPRLELVDCQPSLLVRAFSKTASISYQEPVVSVGRPRYFLDSHNCVVVRLARRDVYLFTRKKVIGFGPVDLEVARLHLVNSCAAQIACDG